MLSILDKRYGKILIEIAHKTRKGKSFKGQGRLTVESCCLGKMRIRKD